MNNLWLWNIHINLKLSDVQKKKKKSSYHKLVEGKNIILIVSVVVSNPPSQGKRHSLPFLAQSYYESLNLPTPQPPRFVSFTFVTTPTRYYLREPGIRGWACSIFLPGFLKTIHLFFLHNKAKVQLNAINSPKLLHAH